MATNEVIGYEHPSKPVPAPRGQLYKTFNSESKPRKTEVFGNTEAGRNYTQTAEDQSSDSCPECDSVHVSQCNCVYAEKTCKSGHMWYTNRDGETIQGNPHKK